MIVKRHDAINLLDKTMVSLSKKSYEMPLLLDIRNELAKGIATEKINLVPVIEKIILGLSAKGIWKGE